MKLFDGPQPWTVKEQIVEDAVTGLTIQFESLPDGQFALRLFGDCLPFGNREIIFDEAGLESGASSGVIGPHIPHWHVGMDGTT